jgi:hypothetical protein
MRERGFRKIFAHILIMLPSMSDLVDNGRVLRIIAVRLAKGSLVKIGEGIASRFARAHEGTDLAPVRIAYQPDHRSPLAAV